ncbi:MAG TPA: ABC transporter ATP-binding protein, partial [Iamia sp.]|nr:ABC transporter ATP-binding protein [Iamia sp.]
RQEAHTRAVELLRTVRLPDPERQLQRYPHQLSGGMRQRVVLAMAVACRPRVLIADEPTTALDVTVQAQILDLIAELSDTTGMAVVLITHDLGMVARYADRVVVMYAGRAVEDASAIDVFADPAHPYSHDLLNSRPGVGGVRQRRLTVIAGSPPDMQQLPEGCAYAPRCRRAVDRCTAEAPPLEEIAPGRWAACWRAGPPTADEEGQR